MGLKVNEKIVNLLLKYSKYNFVIGLNEFKMKVTSKMLVDSEFNGKDLSDSDQDSDSDGWVQEF